MWEGEVGWTFSIDVEVNVHPLHANSGASGEGRYSPSLSSPRL
jgi:hypothetical protein